MFNRKSNEIGIIFISSQLYQMVIDKQGKNNVVKHKMNLGSRT